MKTLIRPCVKALARLGLFLVVVGWLVGMFVSQPGGNFYGKLVKPTDWWFEGFSLKVTDAGYEYRSVPFPPDSLLSRIKPVSTEKAMGLCVDRLIVDEMGFGDKSCPKYTLPHWVMISIWGSLNLALYSLFQKPEPARSNRADSVVQAANCEPEQSA